MEKKLTKNSRSPAEDDLNRCVWMTAGVISFKLCPFNYDCESCDFDRVMRQHAKPGGLKTKVKKQIPANHTLSQNLGRNTWDNDNGFFTFTPGEIDERVYLHPTHLWARREYDHTWKVGIDSLLAYLLPFPVRVELYRPNQEIIQEEAFGRVQTEAGTVFVNAPLSGRLVQNNPRLTEEPDLVQKDPWGEGWLALIDWSQDGAELERLYAGPRTVRFLKEEAQHLKVLLKYRGVPVNPIGATLQDGGAEVQFLHQILPPKLCLNLARELIVSGKGIW
jgi:glycine cleavage system H protein